MYFWYLDEYNFSEIFLTEVGLLIILTLVLIVSKMYVVEIYSRLKGGSWRIRINLHFVKSKLCFFKTL